MLITKEQQAKNPKKQARMQGTITRRPNAHRAERYVGRRGIQPNKVYDSIAGAGRGREGWQLTTKTGA